MNKALAVFLASLACGYLVHPVPGQALRSRCEGILAQAGSRAVVRSSDHLVVIGLPAEDLSREAARALASTQLQPDDRLAVVTLPTRGFHYPLLAGALTVAWLVGMARAWRGSSRVRLTAPLWHWREAQAAVDSLRTRTARERGVLLPSWPVCPGLGWQVSIAGDNLATPFSATGLARALEGRLVDLLDPTDVAALLEAWSATHPVTVRELRVRFSLPELLGQVRRSLDGGDHLRDIQGWAHRMLAGQPC